METFATIYRSETDSSFVIPSELAYHLGKLKKSNLKVALYALDSSSFCISILEFNDGSFTVKSTCSDAHLGGNDFDKAIVGWLAREFSADNKGFDIKKDLLAYQRLYEAAERAKIALSDVESVEINLPFITSINGTPKHLVRVLTRDMFEHLCDAIFLRTISYCSKALEYARLSISDIDEVLLVGRSTNIPKIQELVKICFEKEPIRSIGPIDADAIGISTHDGRIVIHENKPTVYKVGSISAPFTASSTKSSGTPSAERKKKKKLSEEQIAALKSKVEPPLSQWVRYKRYHNRYCTLDLLARETNIKKTNLENYFDYVESDGFHNWLDRLRIEEAQSHMVFYTDVDFTFIPYELGFDHSQAFIDAFVRYVGENPAVWRENKALKIQSGDDPLSQKFNKALAKADAGFKQLIEGNKHHTSYYIHASDLHVSDTTLSLYCAWVLKDSLLNKVNDIRIEEAKQIIKDNPSIDLHVVAKMVGYSTQGTLTMHFKSRMGESPKEWRQRLFPDYKRVPASQMSLVPMTTKLNVDQVDDWIREKRFCRPFLSAKNVSRELGCAETSLIQFLRAEENVSFNEWLSKLRLKEARHILLIKPYLSNEQVGRLVGFTTRASFFSWLKNQTDYTPDEWRSSILEKKDAKSTSGRWGAKQVSREAVGKIEDWVERKGYCISSFWSLEKELEIKWRQLETYCGNEGFMVSMWVDRLRIREAQRLLIASPDMLIADIQDKVGDTERSPFRQLFNRMVGVTPSEWRKQSVDDEQLVAEASSIEMNKPTTPFVLDVEKLKEIESTTTQAQGILSDIFKEDEQEARREENRAAEDAALVLIPLIMKKESWTKAEFVRLCKSHSILPGFAIERINDIAFEKVGDSLIDDAEDVLYINTEYKDSLI